MTSVISSQRFTAERNAMRLLIAAALLAAVPALAQTASPKSTPPDGYIFKSAGEIDKAISKPEAGRVYGATFMNDHENYYIEFVKRLDHGNMVELHPHWVDQIFFFVGVGTLNLGGKIVGGFVAVFGVV